MRTRRKTARSNWTCSSLAEKTQAVQTVVVALSVIAEAAVDPDPTIYFSDVWGHAEAEALAPTAVAAVAVVAVATAAVLHCCRQACHRPAD